MLAINRFPKRNFFNFFKNIFGKSSEIKKAYLNKDYSQLKLLLNSTDHWSFLKFTINGHSLLHEAVEKNDFKLLDIINSTEYKEEILNNQK